MFNKWTFLFRKKKKQFLVFVCYIILAYFTSGRYVDEFVDNCGNYPGYEYDTYFI